MYHVFSEYKVHSHNRNGLCAVAFMDDHYPVRSAFSLLNKVPTIIPEIPLISLHSAQVLLTDYKYSLPVKKLLVRNIVKLDESESHYKYAVRSTFDNCSHTQHCCSVSVHYWTCLIGNFQT